MYDVNTTNNISYFNFKASYINKHIQKYIIKPPKNCYELNEIKYYEGLSIICKKHLILENEITNDIKGFEAVKSNKFFINMFFKYIIYNI